MQATSLALDHLLRTVGDPVADLRDIGPDYAEFHRAQTIRAAAEAWASGNPVLAADSYASILNKWPRDLLALRLVQSCYFFLGWHERFFTGIDAVVPAWSRDPSDFEFVLTMAAFAHAEVLGRKALANDPACLMGVHAVAHAMVESGRHLEGAQWMRDQLAHWAGKSRMRTHNA